MKRLLDLNGIWELMEEGGEKIYQASVPGSVASALLESGDMVSPNWRDNEKRVQSFFEKDYVFSRTFDVTREMLENKKICLRCDGLDTIAEISLNGKKVGKADNMYRTWRFPVKQFLHVGKNRIDIRFLSPVRWIQEHPSKMGKPYSVLRKAACMFGWDWGLSFPDSGIWKDISLEIMDNGYLETVIFSQIHTEEKVILKAKPVCRIEDADQNGSDDKAEKSCIKLELSDRKGTVIGTKICQNNEQVSFEIAEPELWWPVGYGEQPLYTVKAYMLAGDTQLDCHIFKIGLRQIKLDRGDDGDGAKYCFEVNKVPVFFKGENLIIEDSVLKNTTENSWKKLVENCLKSNVNGIRVWGGAYYPPEEFFDLCDEKGILVYQDLMFACSFYQVDEYFLENVKRELEDNLARIGHHACLAALCGNNEIDGVYTVTGSTEPQTAAWRKMFGSGEDPLPEQVRKVLWDNYTPLFLELIPKQCEKYAPDTAYVHSSPSSKYPGAEKSFFDYGKKGDMHYYLPYNENAPYQKMRTMRCRFISEMGFQSYPSMKTIQSFTEEEDRSPYTPVMYAHQKCANGNEAIELYMERDYLIPKDFSDYIFLSQVQAGEIMRYSVEHFRRDNKYCRGIILWQLNDCWPVVSWSGIDYYGRWKALQYYIRRFYAPVLVSAKEEGTDVELWVSNETVSECDGTLSWNLYGKNDRILDKGEISVVVKAGESIQAVQLDYETVLDGAEKRAAYLTYEWECRRKKTYGTVLFVLPRDFEFTEPELSVRMKEYEDCYIIEVSASHFAKAVGFDIIEGDCIFSDNYFDIPAGTSRIIEVKKKDCIGIRGVEDLRRELRIGTGNESMLKAAGIGRG